MSGRGQGPRRGRAGLESSSPGDIQGREPPRDELESVGLISAELLHDLSSLLAVLEGRLAVARSEATLGRPNSSDMALVQKDTRELRRMVRDILAELQAGEAPRPSSWTVAPLLEESIQRWLSSAPKVEVSLEMRLPGGCRVAGPRTFLTRALGNLIRNASRHARSAIRISAWSEDDDRTLEIRVEDDGDGVPEEFRTVLFDPFISSRQGGAGLGLSFSRWACRRLGGDLELLPSPGSLGGAVFRLWLPLSPPSSSDVGRGNVDRSARSTLLPAGLRIAVVDDDTALRRVLRRRFEREGARVFLPGIPPVNRTGDLLRELARWDPQVILLDLNLGSISGEDLFETLARRYPHLAGRVMILTGGGPPERALGIPVMNKLQDWEELIRQIVNLLEGMEGAGDS